MTLQLRPEEAQTLQALVSAGGSMPLHQTALPVSHAIRLTLAGYATLTPDHPQRAVVTPNGRAFSRLQKELVL